MTEDSTVALDIGWVSLSTCSSPYSCPECCGIADQFGDHQVGCGGNADRIMLHNAICDALYEAAQSAELARICETLEVVGDSHSRTADILLSTW